MKANRALEWATLLLMGAVATVVPGSGVEGQEKDKFVQIALWNPVQIHDEEASIYVVRFNILYGKNYAVKGLDIGLVNHNGEGVSKGLQHGVVGLVEGDFLGWQDNLVNITHEEFLGLQSGVYNQTNIGEGLQIGVVNTTQHLGGLQIGLVNYAESFYGIQLGLINIIKSNERLPFFPIINWSF